MCENRAGASIAMDVGSPGWGHAFQELQHDQAQCCFLSEERLAWKNSKQVELKNLEDLKNICKYQGLAQVPFHVGEEERNTFQSSNQCLL